MKQNETHPLFAEERKEQILLLLKKNTKLLVPELCQIFGVSPATIRNDLRDLEHEKKLKRTHGGAIPIGKIGFEPDSVSKEISNISEKQTIAQYAVGLIEDGDTIAVDTGTTMLEFVKLFPQKFHKLTVVTNDIRIAAYLEANTDVTIIVIGGNLRHGFDCTVGPMTVSALSNLNVDKAFIATNAFSIEKGFTTPDLNQAEVKKAMIRTASETIVLCDSSKIGKVSFSQFATISDVDQIITDNQIAPKEKDLLMELRDTLDLHIV
jgi:DeoR family fructose operon transcriptional repressor